LRAKAIPFSLASTLLLASFLKSLAAAAAAQQVSMVEHTE
jgi:hypothetical protein